MLSVVNAACISTYLLKLESYILSNMDHNDKKLGRKCHFLFSFLDGERPPPAQRQGIVTSVVETFVV